MNTKRGLLFLAIALMGAKGCACGKDDKPTLGEPPRITALSPALGSYRTEVTIDGTGFTDNTDDLEVYFDGTLADIVSATDTQLVVVPSGIIVEEGTRIVQVSVITRKQVSNAHTWTAAESGFATPATTATLRQAHGIATDGTNLFIADAASGLLMVDPNTTLVTTLVPISDSLQKPIDVVFHPGLGEVIVADDRSDGVSGDTVLLAVDPANGEIRPLGNAQDRPVAALTVDPATGDVYAVFQDDTLMTHTIRQLTLNPPGGSIFGTVSADTTIVDMVVVGGNLYVSGYGNVDGIFELDLTTGGTVTTVKPLDVPISALGAGPMLADGANLLVVDRSDGMKQITNLGSNPSNLTDASTFDSGLLEDATDITQMGGDWYWLSAGVLGDPEAAQSLVTGDGTTQEILASGLVTAYISSPPWVDGALYYPALFGCALASDAPGALFRVNADGTSERVASGPCGYGIAADASGQIITPDLVNGEVLSVNPTDGNVTSLLDSGDGLGVPYAVFVLSSGRILVAHAVGGSNFYLGRMEADGSNFDPMFADFTTAGLVPMLGAELAGTFVATQFSSGLLYSVDLGNGGTSLLTSGPGGRYFSLTATPVGTVLVSHYDGLTGGAFELFDSGAIWEHFYGELGGEIETAFGLSVMSNNDYTGIDLGADVDDAQLFYMTP